MALIASRCFIFFSGGDILDDAGRIEVDTMFLQESEFREKDLIELVSVLDALKDMRDGGLEVKGDCWSMLDALGGI